jgi:hypothetical protein
MAGARVKHALRGVIDRTRGVLGLPSVEHRITVQGQELNGRVDLLGDAHHLTRLQVDTATAVAQQALHAAYVAQEHSEKTAAATERLGAITAVTSWIAHVDVPETTLVSVVMPTHNRAPLLARALESVTAQTYGNWQALVVDDGSSDETPSVLARYADEPRVVVHRTEGVGSASARNVALEALTGDVVVYLDDDNVFDPQWLKAAVWAFDQRPDVDVLYGARIIDDEDRIRRVGSGALPVLHFDPWDRSTIEDHNIVDLGTIAHRSKLTEARFDPQLSAHDDWDLILRITKDRTPLELPVVALYYTSDAPNRLGDGDLSDQALVRAKLR